MGLQKLEATRVDEVNEGTDCYISFDVYDKNNTLVPVAQISYAVMTLYNSEDLSIINSQENIDVLSYINSSGHADVLISGIHNVVVDEANIKERHVAYFVLSGNAITTITHKHDFNILNLHKR